MHNPSDRSKLAFSGCSHSPGSAASMPPEAHHCSSEGSAGSLAWWRAEMEVEKQRQGLTLATLTGWRPLLLGWRPSLVAWRPRPHIGNPQNSWGPEWSTDFATRWRSGKGHTPGRFGSPETWTRGSQPLQRRSPALPVFTRLFQRLSAWPSMPASSQIAESPVTQSWILETLRAWTGIWYVYIYNFVCMYLCPLNSLVSRAYSSSEYKSHNT